MFCLLQTKSSASKNVSVKYVQTDILLYFMMITIMLSLALQQQTLLQYQLISTLKRATVLHQMMIQLSFMQYCLQQLGRKPAKQLQCTHSMTVVGGSPSERGVWTPLELSNA